MTDIFQDALSDIYGAFKDAGDTDIQDAVFTPAAGDPVPCRIRIYTEDDFSPDGYTSQVTEEITIIEYQLAQINRDAVRGETFTVGATVWKVKSIKERDSVSIRAAVKT